MASKMGRRTEDDLHIHSSHNGALLPSFLSFLSPARLSKENRFRPQNAEPYLSRRAANARIFSENATVSAGTPGRIQKFILFPQWFQA